MNNRYNDLNERLIVFATLIIELAEGLPKSLAGIHLSNQIIRSGTAPALHYGEAQGAESRRDFIHKMKIGLKELRETYNCAKIIERINWYPTDKLKVVLTENNQLISIFVKSIITAQNNLEKRKLES
jgi:four helix bundle protein